MTTYRIYRKDGARLHLLHTYKGRTWFAKRMWKLTATGDLTGVYVKRSAPGMDSWWYKARTVNDVYGRRWEMLPTDYPIAK